LASSGSFVIPFKFWLTVLWNTRPLGSDMRDSPALPATVLLRGGHLDRAAYLTYPKAVASLQIIDLQNVDK
jgi:hypothetical protein